MGKKATEDTAPVEGSASATDTDTAAAPAEDPRPRAVKPKGGWPPDEFSGLGGDYVRDPYTGERRPKAPPANQPA